MANHTPTRLQMIGDYAQLLRETFDRKHREWKGRQVPLDPEGRRAWDVETAILQEEAGYLDAVLKEASSAMWETFVGPWPPTDPLSLAAQWVALLDEIDELPAEYLGEAAGEEDAPMFFAWNELDVALHALDPQAPEVATAILVTAERDLAATGYVMAWEDEEVEAARVNAGPLPSRPR